MFIYICTLSSVCSEPFISSFGFLSHMVTSRSEKSCMRSFCTLSSRLLSQRSIRMLLILEPSGISTVCYKTVYHLENTEDQDSEKHNFIRCFALVPNVILEGGT